MRQIQLSRSAASRTRRHRRDPAGGLLRYGEVILRPGVPPITVPVQNVAAYVDALGKDVEAGLVDASVDGIVLTKEVDVKMAVLSADFTPPASPEPPPAPTSAPEPEAPPADPVPEATPAEEEPAPAEEPVLEAPEAPAAEEVPAEKPAQTQPSGKKGKGK